MQQPTLLVDLAANAKASQILAGARSAFLAFGYEGATVDEIARRAKVSKPTLYNHFPDKRALFIAFVQHECDQQGESIFQVDLAAPGIEGALRTVGRRLLEACVSPFGLAIYRLVISESPRFPELGRAFYASGQDLCIRRLAMLLAAAVGRGELRIDDVELAAQQFVQLCRATCVSKCLFEVTDTVAAAEIDQVIDGAVDLFVRAYRA